MSVQTVQSDVDSLVRMVVAYGLARPLLVFFLYKMLKFDAI